MRPGPNGFMLATFKGEAEKEVEVATVLWRKSLDSKPKAKAKGTSKAKAKAETAKSKKAAKKRAAKKPPVAAPAEEPEEEEEEDDEIAEEPLVRKKTACIIRRARGHGSTAASLKRPAAAPADGEDSDDHPHRFAYMWYKNEAIGLCKYWRSRKSTGIKRKQLPISARRVGARIACGRLARPVCKLSRTRPLLRTRKRSMPLWPGMCRNRRADPRVHTLKPREQ